MPRANGVLYIRYLDVYSRTQALFHLDKPSIHWDVCRVRGLPGKRESATVLPPFPKVWPG